MAAPQNAYLGKNINTIHNGQTVSTSRAILQAEKQILRQRFFIDELLLTKDSDGNDGFVGLVSEDNRNYYMHNTTKLGSIRSFVNGRTHYTHVDAGLNTLGLPIIAEIRQNAVNFCEAIIILLQPWYGSVSSLEVEFWTEFGEMMSGQDIDLTKPIQYNWGSRLDDYTPALDISRAKAYSVSVFPQLNVNTISAGEYVLKIKVGDEFGYSQYLKNESFAVSPPVTIYGVKKRDTITCDTINYQPVYIFTQMERLKVLPNQDLPPRIQYTEPDGLYVWCDKDPEDYLTIYYSNTACTLPTEGYYYGGWNNDLVQMSEGHIGQRYSCTPPTILPPRDAGRFSINITNVDVNGNNATVYITINRELSNGGDAGVVTVDYSINDGIGAQNGSISLDVSMTETSFSTTFKIKNPDYSGINGEIKNVTW